MTKEKDIQDFIGTRIREIREEKHITQEALAKESGIKNTTISAYENHKKSIGLYNLGRIAIALGVTIDELYYGNTETAPIKKAGVNKGRKTVNCLFELYMENIIHGVTQDCFDGDCELTILSCHGPIQKFFYTLSRIPKEELLDPTPEQAAYLEQIKSTAAYEINREIKRLEEQHGHKNSK